MAKRYEMACGGRCSRPISFIGRLWLARMAVIMVLWLDLKTVMAMMMRRNWKKIDGGAAGALGAADGGLWIWVRNWLAAMKMR